MRKKILFQLFLFTIVYCLSVNGQTADTSLQKEIIIERSLNLLAGISFGKNVFADIGVSRNNNAIVGYHPFSTAYFLSTEIKPGERFIIGPKAGAWIAGGSGAMAIGINMIYYTDFDNNSWAFRPEIGFGFDNFKLVYGYNAILSKYKLPGINRHLGSFVCYFKIKQLKS